YTNDAAIGYALYLCRISNTGSSRYRLHLPAFQGSMIQEGTFATGAQSCCCTEKLENLGSWVKHFFFGSAAFQPALSLCCMSSASCTKQKTNQNARTWHLQKNANHRSVTASVIDQSNMCLPPNKLCVRREHAQTKIPARLLCAGILTTA